MTLTQWAAKWGVSEQALRDLVDAAVAGGSPLPGKNEAAVQMLVRLNASKMGWRLWRNNVGATMDANGNFIRYGLCNESRAMNLKFKSSDLIGLRPVLITQEHVGTTIGQFMAVEVKHGSWRPGGSKREQAQAAFLALVNGLGGYGVFSTGELD